MPAGALPRFGSLLPDDSAFCRRVTAARSLCLPAGGIGQMASRIWRASVSPRYRVEPMPSPRAAAEDASGGKPASAERAMFRERVERVFGAGGQEAAAPPEPGA